MNRALASGLVFDDKDNDFEEEFFLQMIIVVIDEVDSKGFSTPQAGGSRMERGYLFHDRKLNDAVFFQDYFSETPTYGAVKF